MDEVKREIIWVDGSVYRNGTEEAEGYFAAVLWDGTLLAHNGIGYGVTNNEAEYRGVLWALRYAKFHKKSYRIISDSQLVVNQIHGKYGCNVDHLRPLRDEARKLMKETGSTVEWRKRNNNLAGQFFEKKLKEGKRERNRRRDEAFIRRFG